MTYVGGSEYQLYDNRKIEWKESLKIVNPNEYYSEVHHPCIVAGCYRKSFIENRPFRENVCYEDCDWKIATFASAQQIALLDFPFYVYIWNPDSTTHAISEKQYLDAFTANELCVKEYQNSNLSTELKSKILRKSRLFYIGSILKIRDFDIWTAVRLLKLKSKNLSQYYTRDKDILPLHKQCLLWCSIHTPTLTALSIRTAVKLKRILCKLK